MVNNYGSKMSDELILAYGFTIPNNAEDHCLVTLARGEGGGVAVPAEAAGAAVPPWGGTSALDNVMHQELHQAATGPWQNLGSRNGTFSSAEYSGGMPDPSILSPSAGEAQAAGEEDDDDGGGRQRRTEELQSDVTMSVLGLSREHHLTTQDPLPEALVHSAKHCLLDPASLYVLMARVMHAVMKGKEGPEDLRSGLPSSGADHMEGTAAIPLSPSKEQQGGQEKGLSGMKRPTPEATDDGADLPNSAMHILPQSKKRRFGRQAGDRGVQGAGPRGLTDEVAARLAEELLGGAAVIEVFQLSALVLLRRQLEIRLCNLTSDLQARDLLGLPPRLAGLGEAPLLPEDDGRAEKGGIGLSAATGSLSHHALLALGYVATQRQILIAALEMLRSRIAVVVAGMHARVLPPQVSLATPSQLDFPGSTFEVVASQPDGAAGAGRGHNQKIHFSSPTTSTALTTLPWHPEYGVDTTHHMSNYSDWLAHGSGLCGGIPRRDSGAQSPPTSRFSRGPTIGLREVLCRPRAEALAAAAAAAKDGTDQVAKKSTSGSGKRRPLASVTLRSLRNHTGGDGPAAAAAAEAATAVRTAAAAAGLIPLAAPPPAPPRTPTLPSGVSAALGLDMAVSYDPMAWGAITTIDLKRGDLVAEVRFLTY